MPTERNSQVRPWPRAISLARANQARLCVIDVLPAAGESPALEQRLSLELDEILQQARLKSLTDLIQSCLGDADVSVSVLSGSSFVQVIRAVLQDSFDLIIKAARPPTGLSERLLGSTDMHLLRKCPCPVLVERQDALPAYRRVLAAVDPVSREGRDCADKVLSLASDLAGSEGARLSVVHAWRVYGESMLESGFARVSSSELDQLRESTEQCHRQRFDQLLERCGLAEADCDLHLLQGEAADQIRSQAEESNADLIVLGTVGRCGVPGFIIGNTAEEVLQSARASILAVKPEAFVSPVTLP